MNSSFHVAFKYENVLLGTNGITQRFNIPKSNNSRVITSGTNVIGLAKISERQELIEKLNVIGPRFLNKRNFEIWSLKRCGRHFAYIFIYRLTAYAFACTETCLCVFKVLSFNKQVVLSLPET